MSLKVDPKTKYINFYSIAEKANDLSRKLENGLEKILQDKIEIKEIKPDYREVAKVIVKKLLS